MSMKVVLERVAQFIEVLNEWLGVVVAWFALGMVLATCGVVFLRYGLQSSTAALQEVPTYMNALIFLIGIAYTFKHDGHVRVDIFYRGFSVRGKAWVDLFGSLLLMLPVCVLIGWTSWDYMLSAWRVLEGSRDAGGIPAVFVLKTLIFMMPILLGLQSVALAARSALVLMGYVGLAPVYSAGIQAEVDEIVQYCERSNKGENR